MCCLQNQSSMFANNQSFRSNLIEQWLSVVIGDIPEDEGGILPVLSGSMGPSIVEGCTMRITRVPTDGTVSGDILVFRRNHGLVAHRQLLRLRFARFRRIYEKGDINSSGSWIRENQMVGVVAEVRDRNGKVLYSRDLDRLGAHREARRQLIRLFCRPLYRVIRLFKRLLSGKFGNGRARS